jgi:hypothetical protein
MPLSSLIIAHLNIIISRSGWGYGDCWCFHLFGHHGLQVNINFVVLEDTEIALGSDPRLVRAFWTKDTY